MRAPSSNVGSMLVAPGLGPRAARPARAARILMVVVVALAGLLAARTAHAQQVTCNPMGCFDVLPDGSLRYRSPPVGGQVTPPSIDPRLEAEARARAQAEARAKLEWEARVRAEQKRQADWQAWFAWNAWLSADAQVRARAKIQAEARAYASRTPDPYAGMGLPSLGPRADVPIRYPRFDIGTLVICGAAFTGQGKPTSVGLCPPLRLRIDETWAVALDPSFLWQQHGEHTFHTLGVSPALLATFGYGRGGVAGSYSFARAGLDTWMPVSGGAATPDLFVGGHVGLGTHLHAEPLGLGAEVRGLVRGGTNAGDDGMARARAGFEVRVYLFSFSFSL